MKASTGGGEGVGEEDTCCDHASKVAEGKTFCYAFALESTSDVQKKATRYFCFSVLLCFCPMIPVISFVPDRVTFHALRAFLYGLPKEQHYSLAFLCSLLLLLATCLF